MLHVEFENPYDQYHSLHIDAIYLLFLCGQGKQVMHTYI